MFTPKINSSLVYTSLMWRQWSLSHCMPNSTNKGDSFIFKTVIKPEACFPSRQCPCELPKVYIYTVNHKDKYLQRAYYAKEFCSSNTSPSQKQLSVSCSLPLYVQFLPPLISTVFSKSIKY